MPSSVLRRVTLQDTSARAKANHPTTVKVLTSSGCAQPSECDYSQVLLVLSHTQWLHMQVKDCSDMWVPHEQPTLAQSLLHSFPPTVRDSQIPLLEATRMRVRGGESRNRGDLWFLRESFNFLKVLTMLVRGHHLAPPSFCFFLFNHGRTSWEYFSQVFCPFSLFP